MKHGGKHIGKHQVRAEAAERVAQGRGKLGGTPFMGGYNFTILIDNDAYTPKRKKKPIMKTRIRGEVTRR